MNKDLLMFFMYLVDIEDSLDERHDLQVLAIHFKTYILTALEKGHFGHCCDIQHSCDRCYADKLSKAADRIKTIYDSWPPEPVKAAG